MSERILIVEDNKTLAKLIAKKITTELGVEADVAFNLSEAKLFLKKYEYFLNLLDLNLPDAPNGEVVDYALSNGNKVIVLSGNIDKEIRKKILQKNVIDYVNKSGIHDIHYIIKMIDRLRKNQKHTILVVDDSMMIRKQMQNILQNLFYNVITVAHGEEALNILEVKPEINMVITDYNMPVMDGLELTQEIRKKYTKTDMAIIALSSNEDDEVNALFLKKGANDYIKKPFSKEEFTCRIDNTIEALENIQIITNHANRDYLTGLYSNIYLNNHLTQYEQEIEETDEQCAIAMITIDYFKKLKETYGSKFADKMIIHIANILTSNTNYIDIVSKYGDKEFCIILKNTNSSSTLNILERLRNEVNNAPLAINNDEVINLSISIGAAMNHNENLDDTLGEADMMLYKAKEAGVNQLFFE